MDNDELRRGKPTNHVVFGEACALLSGDALILYAFETLTNPMLSADQNIKALDIISKLSGVCGMCGGQQIDLENEGKKIDLETLKALHAKKTGALICAACTLGCVAAGKFDDTKEYHDAVRYAKAIGLAFQIADDILDVTGDENKLGKKTGSDEREQKNTYVTLMGIEKARQLACELVNEAKEIISVYPGSEFLCALADYVITRDN
jgi:geranylgeranyl diphosphate synthase type II